MNDIYKVQSKLSFYLNKQILNVMNFLSTFTFLYCLIILFTDFSLDNYFQEDFEYYDILLVSYLFILWVLILRIDMLISKLRNSLSEVDKKEFKIKNIKSNYKVPYKATLFWGVFWIVFGFINETKGQNLEDIIFFFMVTSLIGDTIVVYKNTYDSYKNYLSKSLVSKIEIEEFKTIDSNLKTIHKYLEEFSFSYVFKDRVSKAALLIEEVILKNKDIYKNTADEDVKLHIINSNKELNKQLVDIIKNIVDYSNDKNEEMVSYMERNISILHKLKDRDY